MIEVDGREPIEIPGWHLTRNRFHRPFVYRCFAADGALLYVGMTRQLPHRFHRHAQLTPWWGEVVRYTLQQWPTWGEAAEAEQRAIRDENPVKNTRRPGRQARLWRAEHGLSPKGVRAGW